MAAKFKFVTDNKLRGAFGVTDYDKKEVRINRAKHRKGAKTQHLTPNKDGSENLLTTLIHENLHVQHPKKGEKAVEKLARAMKERMTPKQKAKMYSKLK